MSNSLVLASHANLAEGALSALRLIIGDTCPTAYVSVTATETIETVAESIEEAILAVERDGPGNVVLVVTDIPGGSPTQGALRVMEKHPEAYFITGMSLGLLLELSALPLDPSALGREGNLALVRGAVEAARSSEGLLGDLMGGLAAGPVDADSDEL